MIFDNISNIDLYKGISPRFEKAIEWVKKTNLNELKIGEKYYIDGTDIYANVSEYDTYYSYEKTFEGHLKYIDLQLILDGAEIMEAAQKTGNEKITEEYSNTKERFKVQTEANAKVLVKKNEFTIFFPQDLHKPCINYSYKSDKVRKLVIKILL